MICPRCGVQTLAGANFCYKCSAPLRAPAAGETAPLDPPLLPLERETGDATGGLIPYKNMPALIGYYCGIFSLIPCIGLFFACAALPLGIAGLRVRRRNPAASGKVHAWIAIGFGIFGLLLWGGLIIISLLGPLAFRR